MKIYHNKSFKDLTSIKCGGKIKTFIEINDINELKIIDLNETLIIGNGTNLLASSKDYNKKVIKLNTDDYLEIHNDFIEVNASMSLNKLINILAQLGYYNLTKLFGIPASVGGAVFMNSGAFNDEISNYLKEVLVYDNGFKWISKKDLEFSYRKSNIKGIILKARFIIYKSVDKREFVMNIRKNTQPIDKLTFGSVFKNKQGIHAYQIIDFLDLRGYKNNNCHISNKHANFIINDNYATSEDILELIELIRLNSFMRLGIDLECEVKLINF